MLLKTGSLFLFQEEGTQLCLLPYILLWLKSLSTKENWRKELRKVMDLLKLEEIKADDEDEEQYATVGKVAFTMDF